MNLKIQNYKEEVRRNPSAKKALFDKLPKKTGIYKITSPSKKVYIGQSVNIHKRCKRYSILDCKEQVKLYRSLLKYGFFNHTFEVITTADNDNLNKIERYYQELYNSVESGLNCVYVSDGNSNGTHTEETKRKISKALKGRVFSKEHRAKIGASKKNQVLSEAHLKAFSRKGFKHSEETKLKMSIKRKGVKKPEGFGVKISKALKGRKIPKEVVLKMTKNHTGRKMVLSKSDGVFYDSIKSAAKAYGINVDYLYNSLNAEKNGLYKNKTNIIYV